MKRNNIGLLLSWALAVIIVAHGPFAASATDFYVSPRGDDTYPGTLSRPFATLPRAQKAVRAKILAGLTEDINVIIREGIYRVTEPLTFGPQDSAPAPFRIKYTAHPAERVIISGGRVIWDWRKTPDGNWYVEIPEVKAGRWIFRQLFVNGRRATRARHPDKAYLRVEQVGNDRRTHFRFRAGDIPTLSDLSGVELVFFHDWSITRVPVKTIDRQSRILTVRHQIGGPSKWAAMDRFEKHPRYYLENSVRFLDKPGEWYLDTKTGGLTYKPRPGENLFQREVVAPWAQQLLVVRGTGERAVRNLSFAGLTFAHTGWRPREGVYWGRQACTYWYPSSVQRKIPQHIATPAAIHFELAESCRLEDCHVRHMGPSAVWFGSRCRNCRVSGCNVKDVGGNGIMVGEGQSRRVDGKPWWESAPEQAATANFVNNNLVEHCGRELFGAVGVWVGLAARTTITHNEIRNLPYTGISLGWMWWNPRAKPEPRPTPCRENIVADNHIHHVMRTLSDGGAIYTLGRQPGSFLRANVIHDISVNQGQAESNGMFLDQGTGDFVIADNVIYNVDRSPLRFHKGWTNLLRKNVLAVRQGIPPVYYGDTKKKHIELRDNTILEIDSSDPNVVKKFAPEIFSCAGLEPEYRKRMKENPGPPMQLSLNPGEEISLFNGKNLGDWKVTDFGGQGEVLVKDGVLFLENGIYTTGVTWTGSLVRMNYEITLDAMRVKGNDFFCGLTFPVAKDTCTLILGGWGGQLCGLSCLDYFDAANNETTRYIPFENGKWYRVSLRVQPRRIQAWIDGEELVNVDTTGRKIGIRMEMDLAQPLGIATWITTGAIRNISLKKLENP